MGLSKQQRTLSFCQCQKGPRHVHKMMKVVERYTGELLKQMTEKTFH